MVATPVVRKQFTIEASQHNSKTTLFRIPEADLPRIKTGDLLIVHVLGGNPFGVYEGTHRLNPFYQTPEKVAPQDLAASQVFYEFPFGSLVGSLDDGQNYFPIGNHLEMSVLQLDGNLSLVFWGNDESTIANSVTSTVEVQKKDLEEFRIPVEVGNYIFSDRWQFDIDANANMVLKLPSSLSKPPASLLKTGLCIQPGDIIIVDTHPLDFWCVEGENSGWAVNADGKNAVGIGVAPLNRLNRTFRHGSLVGTLDGGKTFFQVGTHMQMTALNTGQLAFACWDWQDDNQGVIRAYVKVVRNGITITKPSNVLNAGINLGRFTDLAEVKGKIHFDPSTCIWAKAHCHIAPPSIIDQGAGLIKTESGKTYNIQLTVDRGSAGYKNTFGIFPVAADGSVNGVKPGAPTYAETAVKNRIQLPNYDEQSVKQTFTSQLPGGTNYEVFLIANGTPDQFLTENPHNEQQNMPKAYFRITATNPDRQSHIKALSGDTFGFEDRYGEASPDFDDLLVQLKVISVEDTTTSSTPPSTTPVNEGTTLTEKDCPLYPLCKLSQLNY